VNFQLRPFAPAPLIEKLFVSGSLNRAADTLLIRFTLCGTLQNIKRPAALADAGRCHELWRHTCFELFFGVKGYPGYWEVNYCLSGRWNVYRFDGYRIGMREDTAVGCPLCNVTEGPDCLSLSCSLSLNGILDDLCELEAGVAVVIEIIDDSLHYFAIEHPESQPDFHNRNSFLINMLAAGD
jgi:hypothetical protein